MTGLSDQDLEDIAHATDLAARHVNGMSATFARFINMNKRACDELRRRKKLDEDLERQALEHDHRRRT
jgi:hypothetical protein